MYDVDVRFADYFWVRSNFLMSQTSITSITGQTSGYTIQIQVIQIQLDTYASSEIKWIQNNFDPILNRSQTKTIAIPLLTPKNVRTALVFV